MKQTRKGSIPLGIAEERVSLGDHIAYFWETEKQFAEGVRFLEKGLQSNDHCVIFGHSGGNEKVQSVLRSHGFNPEELIRRKRVTVLGGKLTGDAMLAEIGATFQEAIDQGAQLVRMLGNIGWNHPDWPNEENILEFEAKVTGACKSFPCVVLCMYDVGNLSGRIMVHGAYETHPLTFCSNVMRENPHYVDFETFSKRTRSAAHNLAHERVVANRLKQT